MTKISFNCERDTTMAAMMATLPPAQEEQFQALNFERLIREQGEPQARLRQLVRVATEVA